MIRELIGLAQLRAGEFDAAAMELARTVAIRSEAYGPSSPETARLLLPLADAQSKTGDFEGSMRSRQRAHSWGTQLRGPDHPETRPAALWLARWYASGYHFNDAERYFGLASREIEGVADARDPITVAATIDGCAVLLGKGRLDRAEQILTTAAPASPNCRPASTPSRRSSSPVWAWSSRCGAEPPRDPDALRGPPRRDRRRRRPRAPASARLGHRPCGAHRKMAEMFESLVAREQQAPAPRIGEIFARIYFADVLLDHARPADARWQRWGRRCAVRRAGPAQRPRPPLGVSLLGRAVLETGDTEGAGAVLAEAAQSNALFPEHRLSCPRSTSPTPAGCSPPGIPTPARSSWPAPSPRPGGYYGPDHPVVRAMVDGRAPDH